MAVSNLKIILTGLPRRLVTSGLLDEEAAEKAFDKSRTTRTSFVSYVIEQKLVGSQELALVAAEEFGFPLVDIESIELDPELIKSSISQKALIKNQALPIFNRGNRLFVALSDPSNPDTIKEIQFHNKKPTEPILADEVKLRKVIERALELFDDGMNDL